MAIGETMREIIAHTTKQLPADADLFIGALGFESRAAFAAKQLRSRARRALAIAFPSKNQLNYLSNKQYFLHEQFEIVESADGALGSKLKTHISRLVQHGKATIKIIIDISSMSRPMMAQVVAVLSTVDIVAKIDVTFVYCPAQFNSPDHNDAPVILSEPVIPEFAGWTTTPDWPVTAIVGLGYEYGQAIGTLEYLEPAAAWAFLPTGEDERYDQELRKSNKDLFDLLSKDRVITYRLDDPFGYFQTLENLAYGLSQRSRPVIVPFGPKLFALICLLVAQIHNPKVTVWRVSGDQTRLPIDRVANGKIVPFSVTFGAINNPAAVA